GGYSQRADPVGACRLGHVCVVQSRRQNAGVRQHGRDGQALGSSAGGETVRQPQGGAPGLGLLPCPRRSPAPGGSGWPPPAPGSVSPPLSPRTAAPSGTTPQ